MFLYGKRTCNKFWNYARENRLGFFLENDFPIEQIILKNNGFKLINVFFYLIKIRGLQFSFLAGILLILQKNETLNLQ